MSREPCDRCHALQTTIDRLALELAQERAEHRRTADERDQAQRREARWRWLAQICHTAGTTATHDTHQENNP